MVEKARIDIANKDGMVTITGGGTLDLTNSCEFHNTLKQVSSTADSVIVDLRLVDFIDTAIVQDLAKAAVTLMDRDKRLKVLASENRYPLRVLYVSGFQAIMDIEVDLE